MNRKDFLKAAVGVIAAPFVVKEVYGSLKGSVVLNSGGDRIATGAFELPKPKNYPMHVPVNPLLFMGKTEVTTRDSGGWNEVLSGTR